MAYLISVNFFDGGNNTPPNSTMQVISKNISGTPDRLREVISKSGLSQAKFAQLIGEDLQRLKDVLRGQMKAPLDMLDRVVQHCGADATWLVTGYQIQTGELNLNEKILLSWYRELNVIEAGVMLRAITGLARAEAERTKLAASKKKGQQS